MLHVMYAKKPVKEPWECFWRKPLIKYCICIDTFLHYLFQIQRALCDLSIYDILKVTKEV